jgi:hydroxyethylthiazole kinase-like uncharacterized protein yjeF
MKNNYQGWISKFPLPTQDSNKYSRGSVLVMGGDISSTGAARLAALAAARMSAGMVTIACPERALATYVSAMLSIMVRPYTNPSILNAILSEKKIDALLVGPGLEVSHVTSQLVKFLLSYNKPVVIDAGGLSSIAAEKELLESLHTKNIIITPHQGEFEKLFGKGADRIEHFRSVCAKYPEVTILLKGSCSLIGQGAKFVMNDHAHPGLATAGSGDVLAGMIVSLLASKVDSFTACQMATYIHGEISLELGYGMIAEDIISKIPPTIHKLLSLD